MTNFADINSRLRDLLEDSAAQRFSQELLTAAFRQALEEINLCLPPILSAEFDVTAGSRELNLSGLEPCRYLISLSFIRPGGAARDLVAGANFSYRLRDGTPVVDFIGVAVPRAGERLLVCYASGYTIAGFDGGTATTLPAVLESALVNGAAAQACLLRAGNLVERYGRNPDDSARMLEAGRLWRGTFERELNGVKALQEFGFPRGFDL